MLAFHVYYVKCVIVCSFSSMLMCIVIVEYYFSLFFKHACLEMCYSFVLFQACLCVNTVYLVVGPFGSMTIYVMGML